MEVMQTKTFRRRQQALVRACKGLCNLQSQNNVAKVVHDRLIIYEKERENDICEAQGDP